MSIIEAFLEVFAVGGLLCGVAWYFARGRIKQSWCWRAPFCFLIAAAITPTGFHFWGSWFVVPAAFVAPFTFAFDKEDMRTGLLLGVLPIFFVSSIIFGIWTFILRKRVDVA
jgi:hypothetical protein